MHLFMSLHDWLCNEKYKHILIKQDGFFFFFFLREVGSHSQITIVYARRLRRMNLLAWLQAQHLFLHQFMSMN